MKKYLLLFLSLIMSLAFLTSCKDTKKGVKVIIKDANDEQVGEVINVLDGSLVFNPEDYTPAGYDHDGYLYEDKEFTTKFYWRSTPIYEDMTLYIRFIAHEYSISIYNQDLSQNKELTINNLKLGDEYTLGIPEVENKVFVGYKFYGEDEFLEENKYSSKFDYTSDLKLVAIFRDVFKVTLKDSNDETISIVYADEDDNVKLPVVGDTNNQVFSGYSLKDGTSFLELNSDKTSYVGKLDKDVTLYRSWTPKKEVIFNISSTSREVKYFRADELITLIDNPTKEGALFAGWVYDDNISFDPQTFVWDDRTSLVLEAVYTTKPVLYLLNKPYVMEYVEDGDFWVSFVDEPTKANSYFDGFVLTEGLDYSKVEDKYRVTYQGEDKAIILEPRYYDDLYITVSLNGGIYNGSAVYNGVAKYNEQFEFNITPIREGYYFLGYKFPDGQELGPYGTQSYIAFVNHGTVVNVMWEELPKITYTRVDDSLNEVTETIIMDREVIDTITTYKFTLDSISSVKDLSSTFIGYTMSSGLVVNGLEVSYTGLDKVLTIKENWKDDITLVVDYAGGSFDDASSKTITVRYGETFDLSSINPTKDHFIFNGFGYVLGNELVEDVNNTYAYLESLDNSVRSINALWLGNIKLDMDGQLHEMTKGSDGWTTTFAEPERAHMTFIGYVNLTEGLTYDEATQTFTYSGEYVTTVNANASYKNDYLITFNTNGGTLEETTHYLSYYETYTLKAPTRSGYYFMGWALEQGQSQTYNALETVNYSDFTGDKTLYAVWKKVVKATVYNGLEIVSVIELDVNNRFTLPVHAGDIENIFMGYESLEGLSIELIDGVYHCEYSNEEDFSINEVWKNRVHYYISFETTGDPIARMDVTELVEEGRCIGEYEFITPTKEDHTFIGYYLNSALFDTESLDELPVTEENNEITLEARFRQNVKIRLYNRSGNLIDTIELENVPSYSYSLDKKEDEGTYKHIGYRTQEGDFGTYNPISNKFEGNLNINSGIVDVFEVWEGIVQYTIQINTQGGTMSQTLISFTEYELETYSLPENPTKLNHLFLGYTYLDGEITKTFNKETFDFIEFGSNNLVLTATWEELPVITFRRVNNETLETELVTIVMSKNEGVYIATISSPSEAKDLNSTFLGYSKTDLVEISGNEVTYTGSEKALIIQENWKDDISVLVNFNGGLSGELLNTTIVVKYGENIPLPTEPTREHYVFNGYQYALGSELTNLNNTYNYLESIAANTRVLNAIWLSNISLEIDDRHYEMTKLGDIWTVEVSDPIKANAVFTGYSDLTSGLTYNSETKVFTYTGSYIASVSATALYKNNKVISFNTVGGQALENLVLIFNENGVTIPKTTKAGYKFLGWVLNVSDEELLYKGNEVVNYSDIEGNITLYAVYDLLPVITYNRYDESGNLVVQTITMERIDTNEGTYYYSTTLPELSPFKQAISTFLGLTCDVESFSIPSIDSREVSYSGDLKAITLTENWKDHLTLTISYEGGTLLDLGTKVYTVKYGESVTHPGVNDENKPVKNHYKFNGYKWVNGDAFEDTINVSYDQLEAMSLENRKIVVLWLNNIKVNVDGEFYELEYDFQNSNWVGEHPVEPVVDGYTFIGYEAITEGLTCASDFTYSGEYQEIVYATKVLKQHKVITFNTMGGSPINIDPLIDTFTLVYNGQTYSYLLSEKEGFTLLGYTNNLATNNIILPASGDIEWDSIESSMTVYAVWKESVVISIYNGESLVETIDPESEENGVYTFILPEVSDTDISYFMGYYTTSTKATITGNVLTYTGTTSIAVNQRWNTKKNIIFNANKGIFTNNTTSISIRIKPGDVITISEDGIISFGGVTYQVTRDGFLFTGFISDSETYTTITYTEAEFNLTPLTLTANWIFSGEGEAIDDNGNYLKYFIEGDERVFLKGVTYTFNNATLIVSNESVSDLATVDGSRLTINKVGTFTLNYNGRVINARSEENVTYVSYGSDFNSMLIGLTNGTFANNILETPATQAREITLEASINDFRPDLSLSTGATTFTLDSIPLEVSYRIGNTSEVIIPLYDSNETQESYYKVINNNISINFADSLVGSTINLEIKPKYYSLSNGSIFNSVFSLTLKEGVNVYDNLDLMKAVNTNFRVEDNNSYQYIYLLRNIKAEFITKEKIDAATGDEKARLIEYNQYSPAYMTKGAGGDNNGTSTGNDGAPIEYLTARQRKDGYTYIYALQQDGTIQDVNSHKFGVYHRDHKYGSAHEVDNFYLNGNYFNVDGSDLPFMSCGDNTVLGETNGEWMTVGTSAYKQVNQRGAIFKFNGSETDDIAEIKNLSLNGNMTLPTSTSLTCNYEGETGGATKPRLLMSHAYVGINFRYYKKVDVANFALRNVSNGMNFSSTYPQNIVTLDNFSSYNTFNTAIYVYRNYGINIFNSRIEKSAGPLFHFDIYPYINGHEEARAWLLLDENTVISNPVLGTEAWFTGYGASAIMGNIKSSLQTKLAGDAALASGEATIFSSFGSLATAAKQICVQMTFGDIFNDTQKSASESIIKQQLSAAIPESMMASTISGLLQASAAYDLLHGRMEADEFFASMILLNLNQYSTQAITAYKSYTVEQLAANPSTATLAQLKQLIENCLVPALLRVYIADPEKLTIPPYKQADLNTFVDGFIRAYAPSYVGYISTFVSMVSQVQKLLVLHNLSGYDIVTKNINNDDVLDFIILGFIKGNNEGWFASKSGSGDSTVYSGRIDTPEIPMFFVEDRAEFDQKTAAHGGNVLLTDIAQKESPKISLEASTNVTLFKNVSSGTNFLKINDTSQTLLDKQGLIFVVQLKDRHN